MNWKDKLNSFGFPDDEFNFSVVSKLFKKLVPEFSGFTKNDNGWIATTTLPYNNNVVPIGTGATAKEALIDLYDNLIAYGYKED